MTGMWFLAVEKSPMIDGLRKKDAQSCPFCDAIQRRRDRIMEENSLAAAFLDRYPVNPGHTLIIPKRHYASFFEATEKEILAVYDLLRICRDRLTKTHAPDGYNIGVNVNRPAGQSVFHMHIHLIPRFDDDSPNPLGGVRHVIPERGYYRPGIPGTVTGESFSDTE